MMKAVDVVAALIEDGGRFLIGLRPAHKARGLLWEFVGGKVESGESPQQALVRECMEELGVSVEPQSLFMRVMHTYPDITVCLSVFRARIICGTPRPIEHKEIRWITPFSIPDYAFCPADTAILNKIREECKAHMGNYYQPEIETMPHAQIRALQSERLVKQIRRVYDSVPYYRAKMEAKGVKPDDIRGIEDLHKLPFLSKADLREAYPYGLLGAPLGECVRIHSTSGTTGKRVVAFYTQHDVDLWEECCARAIMAAGGTKEDVVQVCYGYGLFTGGLGLHGGSHKVGCLTLPMSSGNTERQLQFMEDLQSTILCCTPSYAMYLAETAIETGVVDKLHLKAGIFGAEAWTEEMRRDIEAKLGLKAYDIYVLTELSGPGVAFECAAQEGMHINEDHFIVEIIDPVTEEVLPDGEKGELVFTAVTKEAFPMIRYRTRDICVLKREKCACGRTHVRMSKPMGRSDDMLIIRGVNVFPSQIETVLLNQGMPANYQIIVDRVRNTDTFDIEVEMPQELFSDSVSAVTAKEKELVSALKSMLGIVAKVHLVAPKSITRSEGKAVRVIDKRKLY